MKTRYRVLCETREKGSECVTARKEEKVRHVSPFLLTQRLGSVAPLMPRSALERRHTLGCITGLDPLRVAYDWRVYDGHRSLLRLVLALASHPTSFTLGGRFGR